MARIRTVKPEFFRHGKLFDAEQETGLPLRVAFAGLWTAADREGRFKWQARQLKLDCLPFDEVDFSRVLDALFTRGFIVKYASKGEEFGFIPSWHEHQVVNNREAASVLPDPEDCSIESITSTRDGRVNDATVTPLVQVQGEGKGREGKGTTPDGVPEKVWQDFLKLRKAKKAPMTETALDGIRTEAEKAGYSLGDALAMCCKRGWQGFEADWVSTLPKPQSGNLLAGAI